MTTISTPNNLLAVIATIGHSRVRATLSLVKGVEIAILDLIIYHYS